HHPNPARVFGAATLHRARRYVGGVEGMSMDDNSTFPNPVYKDTVLGPLFDNAKDDHADGFRRIDHAHLVMLAKTGILPGPVAGEIARALQQIDTTIDPATLTYTGEV